MTDHNQQYKWRQRKKRNARITVWIVFVILAAAGGTFAYKGIKGSNPAYVAENYFKNAVGVDSYQVTTGSRSLNAENQFVQDYTFTYTADGKEVDQKISLTQQNEKKYGLFDQWVPQSGSANAVDLDLIAPADSQVLIDGVSPDASSVREDETLSPGAVCYHLTGVEPTAVLQVNGLPFESYEGTLETSGTSLDVRNMLSVSDNAKVQMEEIGKSMINEIFTAVIQQKEASDLSDLFAKVPTRDNMFRALSGNLFRDDVLQVESISFENFEPTFGDIYYPGRDEESYLGIEMKLSYVCSYEPIAEEGTEEETEPEEETAEEESETESETEAKPAGTAKEATFSFRYQDGSCIVTAAEIPGVI